MLRVVLLAALLASCEDHRPGIVGPEERTIYTDSAIRDLADEAYRRGREFERQMNAKSEKTIWREATRSCNVATGVLVVLSKNTGRFLSGWRIKKVELTAEEKQPDP